TAWALGAPAGPRQAGRPRAAPTLSVDREAVQLARAARRGQVVAGRGVDRVPGAIVGAARHHDAARPEAVGVADLDVAGGARGPVAARGARHDRAVAVRAGQHVVLVGR